LNSASSDQIGTIPKQFLGLRCDDVERRVPIKKIDLFDGINRVQTLTNTWLASNPRPLSGSAPGPVRRRMV
jgi:hypothetical protein